MIFGVAALALQLLLGFAGLLSIGQAAFLGVGAHTSALVTYARLPFEIGFRGDEQVIEAYLGRPGLEERLAADA
jgi:ABC-type branched-subunit amino acid transport system permease subunit